MSMWHSIIIYTEQEETLHNENAAFYILNKKRHCTMRSGILYIEVYWQKLTIVCIQWPAKASQIKIFSVVIFDFYCHDKNSRNLFAAKFDWHDPSMNRLTGVDCKNNFGLIASAKKMLAVKDFNDNFGSSWLCGKKMKLLAFPFFSVHAKEKENKWRLSVGLAKASSL